MLELVTDRTQDHVELLKRLRKKSWSSMTASERAAWYGEAAKGAYNYTDLNRVEAAVGVISNMMGLGLVTKTNWTLWDVPTNRDMERYLGNVEKIRNRLTSIPNLPSLPSSMSNLNYAGANNIEIVLLIAYEMYESMTATWIRSGEVYSGEVKE